MRRVFGCSLGLIMLWGSTSFSREVSFSWEPMEGAVSYELELSVSRDFSNPLMTQKLKTPEFSASLNPGKYFYRVRVIDGKGRPGKWTDSAPVKVSSPTPELMTPADGYQTSYFEKLPEIEFTWKPVDLTSVYEFVIKDAGGTEVAHTTQDKATMKTSLSAGEFTWTVRSLGKSPIPGRSTAEDVPSPFATERKFKITKNDLQKPVLKSPPDGAKITSVTPVDFSWTQDPHTPLADLHLENVDGSKGSQTFENLKDKSLLKQLEVPGHYKWYVNEKEDEKAPSISSDPREFALIQDPLFAGNYELELNSAYIWDNYKTTTSLQTLSPTGINQQSTSGGMAFGLSAGYYVFRSLGFFVSAQTASLSVENLSSTQNELDGTLRLRFGANGFFQEFWFGYRQMDIIEAENMPTSKAYDFVTTGPLVGTRLGADLTSGLKAIATAYYYKPISYNQSANFGPFNADVAGGSLGIKWNFKSQFWLGYRFAIERVNAQLTALLSPPYINSAWGLYRVEPIFLSISFER